MNYEEVIEVEKILSELSTYKYKQIEPKVAELTNRITPTLEAEKRKHYRAEHKLKSSVNRDIVKEIVTAQNLLNGIKTMYDRAYDEVGYHDKATSDYLHAIELLEGEENLIDYAKNLRITRKMRREAKNFIDVINPLVSFVNRNQKILKDLNQSVKQMQDVEQKLTNRNYTPRVKTELEIAFEKAKQTTET